MFRTTHTIKQAAASLALATTIAALVVPTALAGGSPSGTYRDGWYGYAVSQTKQQHTALSDGRSPDTRDAAAAASQANSPYGSSDGWYSYAVSLTKQQHQAALLDGRSPDTRDAAAAASVQSLAPLDGRSQDTRDASTQAHSPVVTIVRSPGFQWSDFGIGIAAAFGLMLLAAVSLRVLTTRNRQPGPVATA
jgi:hypothetical protein